MIFLYRDHLIEHTFCRLVFLCFGLNQIALVDTQEIATGDVLNLERLVHQYSHLIADNHFPFSLKITIVSDK